MRVLVRLGILSFPVMAVAVPVHSSWAGRISFHERATMKLDAANPPGIREDAVPIYHDGDLIHGHNHQVVEAFFRVPGTKSTPAVLADLVSNTFYRPSYLKKGGTSGTFGTSLIAAPGFRTSGRLYLVPEVERADVGLRGRVYTGTLAYAHRNLAAGTTSRTLLVPSLNQTTVEVAATFEALRNIRLTTSQQRSDRMRMLTISSMFSDEEHYDANLIRYESPSGLVREVRLDNGSRRDRHLFARAIEVGSWIEVVKEPGSDWSPDSPSIRIDLPESNNLRLGIQGFLDASTLTSDDSLSIWLEWLDAPDVMETGTTLNLEYAVTAFPPGMIITPEPCSAALLLLGLLPLVPRRRR